MTARKKENGGTRGGQAILCCPVCGQPLETAGRAMRCGKGHSYDIAREGYVNLLMSNQASSKRHGDDRLMIQARTSFLEKGYYEPIARALRETLSPEVSNDTVILDCGCGDGWYARTLLDSFSKDGVVPEYIGIDISKAALKTAAKRDRDVMLAVASAYKLPVADKSCDIVLSVFAPIAAEEFRRALARNGRLVTVTALERHLYGLKQAVYREPYENDADDGRLGGFVLSESRRVEFTMELDGESARRLFMMTPYYYKTSREDQSKLEGIESLVTEASVIVRKYEIA